MHRTTREIGFIALRHVFVPINAIIFAVVVLLVIFGQAREGIFLGAIVILNILLGFGQDVRAWFLLTRLQLLTVSKITRIDEDGGESEVELEEIGKDDRIALALGDQVPCDGTVVSSKSFEVNEGLITGESNSFVRSEGAAVLAGSVVTSGTGILRVDTSFAESRMARMARGLKRYSANPSPIQRSIETIIRYTVYVLLAVVVYIVTRGAIEHEAGIRIVEQIGALASVLVPQGLVVSTTLLFTYGAGHFFNRHVLLQEVNATEKFGRIKNLCMDKTGTLTENELAAERFHTPPLVEETEAQELAALYARHSGDSSQSIRALGTFLAEAPERTIRDALSFSSWRRYGGIAFNDPNDLGAGTVVLVGGPEVCMSHVREESERAWLSEQSREAARSGKHVLCIARTQGMRVPRELDGTTLSVVGLFVLGNRLREGVRDAVNFFQNRGVIIRILSGDHPDTVRTIASLAGIRHTDAIITGNMMTGWDAADYVHHAKKYRMFARVEPEQKEKIIEALKQDGFTAMIGDGANDALSVKKADLGIALYDGAKATRQIAAVVLMRNSFVELPAGVRLADSMIENIEMFAGLFLNQTFLQFLLFALLALAGLNFPLTPLHVTFINYFTVGLPGILISFWAIHPPERTAPSSTRPFLSRVVPLPLALSFVQALAVIVLLTVSRVYLSTDSPSSLLIIGIVALGLIFLVLAAHVYSDGLSRARKRGLGIFVAVEAALLFYACNITLVLTFFGITTPSRAGIALALLIAAVCGIIQYGIVKLYFGKNTRLR